MRKGSISLELSRLVPQQRFSGMRPGLVWLKAGIVETSTVVFALGDPLVQIQSTLPPRLLDVFHLPGLSMSCFLPRPSVLMSSFPSEGRHASPFSWLASLASPRYSWSSTSGWSRSTSGASASGAADINCECSISKAKPRNKQVIANMYYQNSPGITKSVTGFK